MVYEIIAMVSAGIQWGMRLLWPFNEVNVITNKDIYIYMYTCIE